MVVVKEIMCGTDGFNLGCENMPTECGPETTVFIDAKEHSFATNCWTTFEETYCYRGFCQQDLFSSEGH